MKDIESKDDIEILVNTFYESARKNETIGYIFNDVANVNWEEHLPRMYNFWESILLGGHSFEGNPMEKHISLSKKTEMNKIHFDAWVEIWCNTVDFLFQGVKANEAKLRGRNIAALMLYKIQAAGSAW